MRLYVDYVGNLWKKSVSSNFGDKIVGCSYKFLGIIEDIEESENDSIATAIDEIGRHNKVIFKGKQFNGHVTILDYCNKILSCIIECTDGKVKLANIKIDTLEERYRYLTDKEKEGIEKDRYILEEHRARKRNLLLR